MELYRLSACKLKVEFGICSLISVLSYRLYHVAKFVCRAVLVQLGFYFHMKQALGYSRLVVTRPLLFTMGFMLFFSIVIALFKDIPDVKGDKQVSFDREST